MAYEHVYVGLGIPISHPWSRVFGFSLFSKQEVMQSQEACSVKRF